MKIKLTDIELKILTNFTTINTNFLFKKDADCLTTMSTMRNIFAKYDNKRIITDKDIGIYNMTEFLNIQDKFDNAEIEYKTNDANYYESDYLLLKDEDDEVKYFTSDPKNIVAPTKEVIFQESDVTFELKGKTLRKILKFAKLLACVDFQVYSDKGQISLMVCDKKNSTANNYKIKTNIKSNHHFCCYFKVENLKMFICDYKLELSHRSISRFTHLNHPLTYFIALEPESFFDDKTNTSKFGKMLATKPTKSTKK